jgi:hypothetical protein
MMTLDRYGHLLPGIGDALDSARSASLAPGVGNVIAIR